MSPDPTQANSAAPGGLFTHADGLSPSPPFTQEAHAAAGRGFKQASRRFRPRITLYAALNIGFAALTGMAVAISGAPDPRIAYVCALFALCTTPLLYAAEFNGRYTLLCIFLPFYFLFFGADDLLDLLMPPILTSVPIPTVGLAEVAILIGAVMAIAGYRAALAIVGRRRARGTVKDWPDGATIVVGVALWALGLAANWYWQVKVQRHSFGTLTGYGAGELMWLMLARLVQPLGMVLLSYRLVLSRSRALGLFILGLLAVELVVGFVSDSKELAMRGMALVLITRFLLDGRMPKAWLAAACAVAILATPIFQAYRTEVLSGRKDRGVAAENLQENFEKALHSRKRENGGDLYTSRSFLARLSMKPTIELILQRVGNTARFQDGYTIALTLTGFVPRVMWPDKPDSSAGQLFNRELHISQFRDVYVSVSELGELYWNFGWPGIVIGMLLIGAFLGVVGGLCDLSAHRSVTRLLVVVVTTYLVCARFEDNIAMTFILWIRSIAAVALLHLVFARRRIRLAGASGQPASRPDSAAASARALTAST